MPPYLRLGSIPRKRHIAHPHEPGFQGEGIYYEEVVTSPGSRGPIALSITLRPPTRVVRVEPAGSVAARSRSTSRPCAIITSRRKAIPRAGDPISGRSSCWPTTMSSLARCRPDQPQAELFRNADADEVLFVHSGRGTLHTMFGPLPFRDLDYVVIPRCTTYRLEFEPASQPDLLVIEAAGNVTIPPRYLNPDGQLRLGAPYSERDLHGPREIAVIDREQETTVLIKDGRRLTRYTLASHPSTSSAGTAWCIPTPSTPTISSRSPARSTSLRRCSRRSRRPGSSSARSPRGCSTPTPRRSRCPTPIRTSRPTRSCIMFEAGSAAAGASRRRRSRSIPGASPTARTPAPSSPAATLTRTDELAVMVDTVRPLRLTRQAMELDDPSYPLSWID